MARQKPQSGTLFLICVTALVVYLVLTPLGMLIWNSLKTTPPGVPGALTFANFTRAYSDPTLYPLLVNSLLFAAGSTLFAFLLAFMMAWLVERTNAPLRDLAYVIAIVATIIPGMIASIAWIMLLHPRIGLMNLALINTFGLSEAPLDIHSMYGMIFVAGLRHVPVMFLLLAGALRSMDPSLEESSAACGSGNPSTMLRITFPLMLPASAAAMIYSFINSVEAFEIPALLGMPVRIYVFATKIYLAMHQSPPDYGVSAALGTTVLAISAVGTLFYLRILRKSERYVTVTGKGYRPRPIDLGKWKYLGTAFLFGFLFLDVILPMMALIWASLLPFYQVPSLKAFQLISLGSYFSAWQYPGVLNAVKNSLLLAVVGGCLTMLLAAVISWIVVRSRVPGRRLLDFLAFAPLATPSIVLGMALVFLYLSLPVPIYGTLWILLIAFVTKYMPWATRNTNAALLQIHKELEEASEASGASWLQTFRRVLAPLLVPAFISGFLYIFSHIIRDISLAILLYSPKSNLFAVVIWELWQAGTIAQVGAISVILVVLLGIVSFAGRKYLLRVSMN
jgi:iron(III) transport system permease protein